MIRHLALLAIAAIHFAVSSSVQIADDDKAIALVQKMVFDLLWYVDQPDKVHPEIYKVGTSWDIEANIENYTNKVVVKEFLQRYHYGMLPRGRIFSVYYKLLLDEAVALFKLFQSAGDYDTFLKTACWARVHINEGQFVYAFYLTVMHRTHETETPIYLPLPSEIMPNYFFNNDVMQEVYNYKMTDSKFLETKEGTPEPFVVMANYSHWNASSSRDPEAKLSYFREDVGLNTYYFFYNLQFPFWMSSAEYKLPAEYRGEFYYYVHKFLFNRYRLERYSHGLGDIEGFSWDAPIVTGYTPDMSYRNGFAFPQRKENSMVPEHKYKFVMEAKEFETRVLRAIHLGYYLTESGKLESLSTKEGFNIIGNMIEGNADSIHRTFYGSIDHFFRNILGFSPKPQSKYEIVPSALEHSATSMRDPAFYRIYARIMGISNQYEQHLGYYTDDELAFKGVAIESVAIDKLSTYFDFTDSLVSNAALVYDHQDAESFMVKARQYRLNHKPFTYHMTIKSAKNISQAYVRIFLGPKFNMSEEELDISANFYQVDQFATELKFGVNKIERKSTEAFFTIPDYESGDVSYKRILESVKAGTKLNLGTQRYGFPERLILPRGKPEGLPVEFMFYVSEFVDDYSANTSSTPGEWAYDGKPAGFPLNRAMHGFNSQLPNIYFKDASIFHEDEASP